ncbi:MAG: hypothetical protein D6732_12135 [Methanobacteriota archaeon]|nr:MAG: hypothetical protein D6732_12135 [Euryarchaeota archaeon]
MAEPTDVSLYIRRLQVISQDGLTIYHYPDTFKKNPQLISGMLSAVFLFIKEEYGGNVKSIMLSDRKINFIRYGNYLIILELETFVDEGCTQIFFDYLLDLMKPVFDKAKSDYNLAITLLESIDLGQIFSYERQLEILMRHEVPRALQDAFILMRRNKIEIKHTGNWSAKAIARFKELFDNRDQFEAMNIGKAEDGSFQTLISDSTTKAGVLFLYLPTYSFQLLIALPEKRDSLLLNIETGLKNLFSYLFEMYPQIDLEKIKEYLLSLRFPIEIKHDHESQENTFKEQIPDMNPIKFGVLAFELLGSDLAVAVERVFTGEKVAIVCGEIAAFAIKTLFQHFLPNLTEQIQYFMDSDLFVERNGLILIHPRLETHLEKKKFKIIKLGEKRQKTDNSSYIYRIFREATEFTLENRLIFFAEKIKEMTDIYGDILFCTVAEFDRERARKQLKRIKATHKDIYELGKKKLAKEYPQLISHLNQLERGSFN